MTHTDPADWCVLWLNKTGQVFVARKEDALNYNASALMNRAEGGAIVRMDLTRSQADRHAQAMQEFVRGA